MSSQSEMEKLLERLRLESIPPANHAGLFSLAAAFRHGIPFENLDVLAGMPVRIDLRSISEKILINGRGGYCYELNQLLAETLRFIGMDVHHALARVCYLRPSPGPLTHLVLIVKLGEQRWLVDVGFGGPGPTEPLNIDHDETTAGDGSRYRLVTGRHGDIMLTRWLADSWTCLYRIEQFDVMRSDLEMANHFVSTWPQSPFRTRFMCIAHEKNASWTVDGHELVCRNEHWAPISKHPLANAEDLRISLASQYRIHVPIAILQKAWKRVQFVTPHQLPALR